MFNKKYKVRIAELEEEAEFLRSELKSSDNELYDLKNRNNKIPQPSMADLMRESLGFSVDYASADKDTCLPPHYLNLLSEEERENFIIDMETIHSNERFQQVVRYFINWFAMNAMYKADEEQRNNGRIAMLGFRSFLKEFDKMHTEFLSYKKSEDNDFDPLATLPE